MKKLIILVFISLFFSSCINSETKKSSDLKTADTSHVSDTINSNSSKQIDSIQLISADVNKLPKGIKYEGKIKQVLRWFDKFGENIVITTETGGFQNPKVDHENDGTDTELFAYHYSISNNQANQTWKIHDFIYDCPVDYEATFIKNTFQITDLNNNGIAETWLMYKTVCHGDVSPYNMKIIMYEGKDKYAMRGQNKVELSPGEFYGGEYKFDNAFNKGPKEYRDFAKKLWNKNIMQTWGND